MSTPPQPPSDDSQSPYVSPADYRQPPAAHDPNAGDATGGVIPYKNVHALLAYYLGILGMIPCLGLFAAVPALVLGIMGLRNRNRNPAIKGSVHAWIGIVLGGIFTIVWLLGFIFMFVGVAFSA